jgi:hypothetical protein
MDGPPEELVIELKRHGATKAKIVTEQFVGGCYRKSRAVDIGTKLGRGRRCKIYALLCRMLTPH